MRTERDQRVRGDRGLRAAVRGGHPGRGDPGKALAGEGESLLRSTCELEREGRVDVRPGGVVMQSELLADGAAAGELGQAFVQLPE